MAQYLYSYQGSEEKIAKAVGRSLPISTKQSIEICALIRNKPVSYAMNVLDSAAKLKQPLPFRRFVNGYGHKPGMASGRFAVNAAKGILETVNNAVKNAQNKSLGAELVIVHAVAQHASRSYRHGRQSRRKEKKTHVEIIVAPAPVKEEGKGKESKGKSKSKNNPETR